MKIVIYARVSKEERDPEKKMFQDPSNQLIPLREFAKSNEWEIVKEFIDRASGGDSNRPMFQKMMSMAAQRRFDMILVWALDRFSREGIIKTLSYLEKLKRFNIALKSYQEGWLDTRDEGVGQLLLTIMSWVAEQERKRISQRTKAGIQRRRNLGVWKGGRPKGSKDKKPRQYKK